jgi:hypothetical protein
LVAIGSIAAWNHRLVHAVVSFEQRFDSLSAAAFTQAAWFAALAIEFGCERITTDRD